MVSVINMIVTIVNSYHWTPEYIESMYVDKKDINGIEFWYNEIDKQHKEIDKPKI